MKFRTLMCITAMTLSAALAVPIGLTAQDQPQLSNKHHHYQLVDMGTFGGPNSAFFALNGVGRPLNNRGEVAGWADTSTPDPFQPNLCFNLDCYLSDTFLWRNGVRTDLGTLGGVTSDAVYISDSGLIVSDTENGEVDPLVPGLPEYRAVLWQNGTFTDLGTLPEGGYQSFPNGVNNRGQVVGFAINTVPDPNAMPNYSFPYPYQSRAFFWEDGVMQDLGTLGGTDAQAAYINDRGQVVGYSYTGSAPSTACATIGFALATDSFIWDPVNGMKDLGNFGGTCTVPYDLNNRGQVVGQSTLTGDQAGHAFAWDGMTGLTDLGTLGGSFSNAFAINENGEVAGWSNLKGDLQTDPVVWLKKAGKWRETDLGTLNGSNCSYGTSINARGQVVGNSSRDSCITSLAFVWEEGGPMVDLNTLVPPNSGLAITEADTINDRGEIAVNGHDADGHDHAVLLIPCDENHPDVEGCDYSLQEGRSAAEADSAQVTKPPSPAPPNDNSSIGLPGQFLGRLAHRHPGFGIRPPK